MRIYLSILILLTPACAAQQRSIAYQGAQIARQLADDGALAWKEGVVAQADKCRVEVPKESSTKAEREACMGTFNETDKAVKIFEGLVAAQSAVYWALKFGEIKDVAAAVEQLDALLRDAKPFLEAVGIRKTPK